MKKSTPKISQQTQQFILSKITKVQNQLNKLSTLVSNDQQLNNNYIKKFLQQKSISSSSSSQSRTSSRNTNKLLTNIDERGESQMQYNSEVYEDNQTLTETISKLSIIRSKENDTTNILKVEEEGFIETMIPGPKQNIRTQQNNGHGQGKVSNVKKDSKVVKEVKVGPKAVFNEIKLKPKMAINVKSSKCLNSGNRSKGNLSNKKSKEIISPYVSKRKSTKPSSANQLRQESHHIFDNIGAKQFDKYLCPVLTSPKLNKINGNRFRENLKKTIEIQNQQQGLHSKFHLNLSQQKPLMHRVIEKNNFERVYEEQTKKYEACVKSLTENVIMTELDSDFRMKSESLKLIMVFLSQFSETIRKFFKDKPQEIELKFTELIKQTISMLIKLPNKLYRNNYVSYVRYQSLINSKIGIHKASSKLEHVVQVLRDYMVFLSRNGLIEMTQRANPHSERKIVDYYSHRSKKQKIRNKGKLSDDFQDKVSNKFDTDRQYTGNNNTSRPVLQVRKKAKSPQVLKSKVIKIQKRTELKPKINNFNISKVKSEETFKHDTRKNPSVDLLKKRF